MDQLTEKELEILVDAVKAWKNEGMNKAFSKSLITMMMPKNPDDKEGTLNASTDIMDTASAEASLREETAILLQAKLIRMKNMLIGVEA